MQDRNGRYNKGAPDDFDIMAYMCQDANIKLFGVKSPFLLCCSLASSVKFPTTQSIFQST